MLIGEIAFGWTDFIDVGVVTIALGAFLVWLRRARARFALIGIAIAGAFYLLARFADLHLTAWIFQGFFAALVIVLIVVFQEDVRRLFEAIAVMGLRRKAEVPTSTTADILVRVSSRMAQSRTGALIVLPGREPLDRHIEGGIDLDGRLSEPLLLSIFDSSSPGHDGAAIVAGDRVTRFAIHLPLSTNQGAIGPGGTRHAAALGLSERTDALCLVVSEERGTISLGHQGVLRGVQPTELAPALRAFVERTGPDAPATSRSIFTYWREAALALAFAMALWVVRVPGSSIIEVTRTATIIVEKLPEGFEIESVTPSEVEVKLSGLQRDLLLGAGEQPEIRIDALLVKLGRRTFQVTPDQVVLPPGVRAIEVDPGSVRLSLREIPKAKPDSGGS